MKTKETKQREALQRLEKHMTSTHPHTEKSGKFKDNTNINTKDRDNLQKKLGINP